MLESLRVTLVYMSGYVNTERREGMKNPASIPQPKLRNPIVRGRNTGNVRQGNKPYLRFRRRMRRDLF